MNAYIITGASRGLGAAISKQLIDDHSLVIALSRTVNQELISLAEENNVPFHFLNFDLADIENIPSLMTQIFEIINAFEIEKIALINNAGILDPMMPIEKVKPKDLQMHMNINLVAPMLLSSEFIRYTSRWQCEKTIFNISSGAAHNPYFGWAAYCSSKAGLNMFTQVAAEEQYSAINPVKIIAFAPGVIETDMQKQIRSVNEKDFKRKEKFVNLKNSGALLKTKDVARVIIQNIFNQDFPQGAIIDARELDLE
ncbi:MAG: (S)-benzoin forming benzil reductase [Bacteroidales bacterium]|nr:(S)-benzoin forming benzil reductase [Bacteroidales bacterium]